MSSPLGDHDLDIEAADLAFPVIILSRKGSVVLGARKAASLRRPRRYIIRYLKGAELIDSRFRRLRISRIDVTDAAIPWWKECFRRDVQVELDFDFMDDLPLHALKARLEADIVRRPRNWAGQPNEVGETLAALRACSSMAELVGTLTPPDFAGNRCKSFRPPPPRPPRLELDSGCTIAASEANLHFPVIGVLRSNSPAAARNLTALTHIDLRLLRSGDLMGMELIDARWRRFQIVRLRRRDGWAGQLLRALAGLAVAVNVPVDYELKSLGAGSLESTRRRMLEALEANPWRFCQAFSPKEHDRERLRLANCHSAQAFGEGFATSPFARDYVAPEPAIDA